MVGASVAGVPQADSSMEATIRIEITAKIFFDIRFFPFLFSFEWLRLWN
jgi:hypothetical protein